MPGSLAVHATDCGVVRAARRGACSTRHWTHARTHARLPPAGTLSLLVQLAPCLSCVRRVGQASRSTMSAVRQLTTELTDKTDWLTVLLSQPSQLNHSVSTCRRKKREMSHNCLARLLFDASIGCRRPNTN